MYMEEVHITSNTLIAKFMDYRQADSYYAFNSMDDSDNTIYLLDYRNCWDQLMTVLEKICKDETFQSDLSINTPELNTKRFHLQHMMFHEVIGNITSVYAKVYDFVNTYYSFNHK